jgi:hypothetical protein
MVAQGADDASPGGACRADSDTSETIGETDIHGSHKLEFA